MGDRLRAWPVVVLGCAGPAAQTQGVSGAKQEQLWLHVPKVRIVDPQLALSRSARHEEITVPFGVNQNGTELVYALLERAAETGARYVSDMRVYMTFRLRGTAVECRTLVMLEGDPRLTAVAASGAAAPSGPYQTDVSAYQPQAVEFVAEDRDLVCHKVTVPVHKRRRVRDSDRSAETGRLAARDPDDREQITELEERDDCEWRPVTRKTTRYDYEVKLGYVPPNWEQLEARFARRALVAGQPTCYALADEEVSRQPVYRLSATAYHRGKVTQRMPEVSPSMATLNQSDLYGVTKEGCG